MAAKMLTERLQAARSLIDSLSGTPMQASTATKQAVAIQMLLTKLPSALDEKTVSDCVSIVRRTCYSDEEKEQVMKALTSRLLAECGPSHGPGDGPSPLSIDAKTQDYTAVIHYVTTEVWKSLEATPIGLIEFVKALGLHAPDARTFQTLAAISAVGSEGIAAAVNLSPTAMNGIFKMFKSFWTRAKLKRARR